MIQVEILFDENLSEAVPARLKDVFPNSLHFRRDLGIGTSDERVWEFTAQRGLTLVTRDEDYERMSSLRGAPPKAVWIAMHNPTNAEIAVLLRAKADAIVRFQADPHSALLVLH